MKRLWTGYNERYKKGYWMLTVSKRQPGGTPHSPRDGLDILHFMNSVLSHNFMKTLWGHVSCQGVEKRAVALGNCWKCSWRPKPQSSSPSAYHGLWMSHEHRHLDTHCGCQMNTFNILHDSWEMTYLDTKAKWLLWDNLHLKCKDSHSDFQLYKW